MFCNQAPVSVVCSSTLLCAMSSVFTVLVVNALSNSGFKSFDYVSS